MAINKIKKRESASIERKSSFRLDFKLKQPNRRVLEKIIAKTVAVFMNAHGDTRFIGVDDEGNTVGLQNDCETLMKDKQNHDGSEIEVRQSMEEYTKNKVPNDFCFIQ
ncbi:MAG: AlbA family DNA-binding domain-containing protein [Nitrososphaeraceae archaeon]